jgi:uncharacterized membrane protein YeaQ/YmgE (transglycosylase-associated protein family)
MAVDASQRGSHGRSGSGDGPGAATDRNSMNIVLWVAAGAALGWISYSFLRCNQFRGMPVSIVIGAAGAFLGGALLAPAFSAVAAASTEFSAVALLFATAAASASLFVGDIVHERWDI